MSARMEERSGDRRSKQTRFAIIALSLAAVVVLIGGSILAVAVDQGIVKSTGDYSTTRLVPGSYSDTIDCTGTVKPIRIQDMRSQSKGTVTSVKVKDGDHVSRGDILFEIQDGQEPPKVVVAEAPGTVINVKVQANMPSSELTALDYALQIADMNVLIGCIEVPEYAVSLIQRGEWVTVSTEAVPNVEYDGMVTDFMKSNAASSSKGGQPYYDMDVMFNDSSGLQINMPITAHIHIEDFGQVYYVPSTAVREIDSLAYVDVVHANGVIEQHQVELLGQEEDGSKIIKGNALTSETVIRANLDE